MTQFFNILTYSIHVKVQPLLSNFELLLSNRYCLDIELLLSNHYCLDIELLVSKCYCPTVTV